MVISESSKKIADQKFNDLISKLCPRLRQKYLDGVNGESDSMVAFAVKWIISHSLLSDLLNFDYSFFHSSAEHGVFLVKNGYCDIPEDLFLNYVLPIRLGNEELCLCRKFFFDLLKDRIKGLSTMQAIIEINYFNAENVEYQNTDFRTMSALAAFNASFGRCGEESVFAVNVYRSVGIPARQVYTPRWSHCDDNHAWIEVWCDGKWHFTGACEPEESLDQGWFKSASSRAMFIQSVFLGEPKNEDILFKLRLATYINCLKTYAETKKISIFIEDKDKKPVCGAKVMFGVLNYSHVYPCVTLTTDDKGMVSLTTGLGSLNVRAVKDDMVCDKTIDTRLGSTFTLALMADNTKYDVWEDFVSVAPSCAASKSDESIEKRQLNKLKITAANKKREAKIAASFDDKRAKAIVDKYGYEYAYKVLSDCRGNFDNLCEFFEDERYSPIEKERLIATLTEKDLLDVDATVLKESLDTAREEKDDMYYKYVMCPRVWFEHLSPCRKFIREFFTAEQKRKFIENPMEIKKYIDDNIKYYPDFEYGNVLTDTIGALVNKSGNLLTQKVLFVNICRALDIPARLNPVNNLAEFYFKNDFICVENIESGDSTIILVKDDSEVEYLTDFAIGVLTDGNYVNLDLKDLKWRNNELEINVKSGEYRIITDNRLPNGNVYASKYNFILNSGEIKRVRLHKYEAALSEMLSSYAFEDFRVLNSCKEEARISELTRSGGVIIKLGDGEPTEHILDEILSRSIDFGALENLIFILKDERCLTDKKISKVLKTLINAKIYYCLEEDDFNRLNRQLYLDPDKLPLIVVSNSRLNAVYACSGYNVGSADMIIKICKYLRKTK